MSPTAAPLHEIFYISQSQAQPEELTRIVDASVRNNLRRGVTGMLVFTGGHFAQLIEGGRDEVLQTMAAIDADPRHRQVQRLMDGGVEQRSFGQFSMGWLEAPGADELLTQLLAGPLPLPPRARRLRQLLFKALPDTRR